MAVTELRILGIDPGSRLTGYGLLVQNGSQLTHVESGVLSASTRLPIEKRLHLLHGLIGERIDALEPDEVAIEDLFHATNAKSALQLAHLRGVLLLAAVERGVPVASYAPRAVKKAVVGHGSADKAQVAWMLPRLLHQLERVDQQDAGDALAVAICHAHLRNVPATRVKAAAPRGRARPR